MDKQLEVVIRPVLENDLPVIAELDQEAFSAYGTAEDPQTFALRYQAFPAGFIVLTEDDRIVAYGCGEKWLTEREPGLGENPLETHHPDGRIFCITGMAVRLRHRRKGYGLAVLDRLIEIARQEGCTKILLETTHAQGLSSSVASEKWEAVKSGESFLISWCWITSSCKFEYRPPLKRPGSKNHPVCCRQASSFRLEKDPWIHSRRTRGTFMERQVKVVIPLQASPPRGTAAGARFLKEFGNARYQI